MSDWCTGKNGVWLCGGHDHENNYFMCRKCGGSSASVATKSTKSTKPPPKTIPIAEHFVVVAGPFKE